MSEYRILSMRDTGEGYHTAVVLSHYDQQEYRLHDRWGSWFIGLPDVHGGREPATISRSLVFDLQDYKNGKKVEAPPPKENPFVKKAKQRDNPFLKKAAEKANPFIAKAKKV